ncbi:MAG: LD-carboxypeptidase [Bacillaceae bacterium]
MRKPTPLKIGDTIGLIGTSSPTPSQRLEPAVQALQKLGLHVVLGESCQASYGYLSGSDTLRAQDVNKMFANPEIKGVFAIRGGYGAPRILDLLDYELIKNNPKVFVGYSDVTALHQVFNQICDFITYHAPMPSTELYKGIDAYTEDYYYRNLFQIEPLGKAKNPEGIEIETLVDGEAEGILIGGNLSLVTASLGTRYEIDTKGKILFLEDIDEYTYRIDRMLVQLKQAGKLDESVGIILGGFTNCEPENPERSLTLQEVFHDHLQSLSIPILSNIACGHCMPTMTLPLGARTRINTYKKEITILE